MISDKDIKEMGVFGVSLESLENQLEIINRGVSYQTIDRAAVVGDGIIALTTEEKEEYHDIWQEWNDYNRFEVNSLVPASGAATRMFKVLYQYIDGEITNEDPEIKRFFDNITHFPFYETLNRVCISQTKASIQELIERGDGVLVCKRLLFEDGLCYGLLPKGLLLFHKDQEGTLRTPVAEHIAEACLFRGGDYEKIKIHFTVSKSAEYLFEKQIEALRKHDPILSGQAFEVSFSDQKTSTDTLALDEDGNILRDGAGVIILRPGGHGALIENLNDLRGNVVFIRNIDNVAPIHKMSSTIYERGVLAGFLLKQRERIFQLLIRLDNPSPITEEEKQSFAPLLKELNTTLELSDENRKKLKTLVHRPIRVCGMVKNVGEPGGGPFWVQRNHQTSLLILEKAQVDTFDAAQLEKFEKATHFNPVDIVCSVCDYKGQHFNLRNYVDYEQSFIVEKSINGRKIKALELPGLWNGGMADWLTFFLELPQSVFTPVKTINDLLREEHQ